MAKRIFDVLGALLALLVLWPVMLVLAVWVKIDSPGPVFFRQVRVGRGGRAFQIIKFRTMTDGPAGLLITVGQDPRITRVGTWARSTRLDELPQFFNVLLGHMSLVGPRPEVPRYVAHYPPELRAAALAVRPGMTDPAALAFIDEAALLARHADPEQHYIQHILPTKVAHAVAYAQRATLLDDLRVLATTLRTLLTCAPCARKAR